MDGETPQKEREYCVHLSVLVSRILIDTSGMPMIEKFNTDPSINIFLISIQTGGTGLNLTGESV